MIKNTSSGKYEYDICIIGGGPAGLVVASELAYDDMSICVLESGKMKRSNFSDDLKKAIGEKFPIKNNSRERVLGGASSTWGGLSSLLDDVDFFVRGENAGEGWPITKHELYPFLKMAEKYRFPSPESFNTSLYEKGWGGLKNLEDKIFIAVRPPFHFGSLRGIFNRPKIDLFTDATVIHLLADSDKVTEVVCMNSKKEKSIVKANIFVLATGGIENPRILLNSGIGNEYDQVGRYFMNHPKGYAGLLKLSHHLSNKSLYLPRIVDGRMVYAGIRLKEEFQKREGLLNSCVQFEPDLRFLQRYAFAIWKRLPDITAKILSVLRPRFLRLRWFADMEPRSENRVTLSKKEKDIFGNPYPVVSYEFSKRDKATLVALHEELKKNLSSLNLGKLYCEPEDVLHSVNQDASHHLGGTRMGKDPNNSVVDVNCKVHSMDNLYVAGGSVFSTGGCANPTLTITALAIRLAEHLNSVVGMSELKKSENLKSGKDSDIKDKIIIIGAGKRVTNDVVPAIESLSDNFTITGIFARHSGSVFGSRAKYKVEPVTSLSEDDLKGVRFVYISVPRESVLEVIKNLPKVCSDTEIIIDTPVYSKKTLKASQEKGFRQIHIAEDMIFLPWIEAVLKAGPVREVRAIKSLYRYHGIALLKVLAGGPVRWGLRFRSNLFLKIRKVKVSIKEPRDYSSGKLFINQQEVSIIKKEDFCVGFSFMGVQEKISESESKLIGPIDDNDTIVSLMPELKRVGLGRFLEAARLGEDTWTVLDGLNDFRTDSILHRFFMYISKI